MATITAAQVSDLRKRTGVSMMAVKSALEEAGGNEEKAIEILRKRGQAQAVKKSAREQREGVIFSAQTQGKAALLLLGCETDFVARNEDFRALGHSLVETLLTKGAEAATMDGAKRLPEAIQKLGENLSIVEMNEVSAPILGVYVHTNGKIGVIVGLNSGAVELARDAAMHAAAMNPQVVSPEEVKADAVEKEKEIWREQLKKEGKPEAIWDKIMVGKEKKFREESALLKQPFAKDPSKTVEQHLAGAKVTGYVRLSVS